MRVKRQNKQQAEFLKCRKFDVYTDKNRTGFNPMAEVRFFDYPNNTSISGSASYIVILPKIEAFKNA